MGFFSSCLPVPEFFGDWIHTDLFNSVFLYCKWELSSFFLLEVFCTLMTLFSPGKYKFCLCWTPWKWNRKTAIFFPPNFMCLDLFDSALPDKTDRENLITGKAWGKDVATKQVWFGHTAYLLDTLHFSRRMSPSEPTMLDFWLTSCLN